MIAQILAEEILADSSQNRQPAKISGHTVFLIQKDTENVLASHTR